MAAFREEEIARIRAKVGDQKVICGLSGGRGLVRRRHPDPRGDRRSAHLRVRGYGLLRSGEADQVVSLFRNHYNIPLIHMWMRATSFWAP